MTLPVGAAMPSFADLSQLPLSTEVLLVLSAVWVALRAGFAWVWLRRKGYLDGVANAVPML